MPVGKVLLFKRFEIFLPFLTMKAMNTEIIIRLRSPEGQNRLTAKAGDTFG